jgi:membrane fusion protein (multidrug efflux system)
MKQTALAMKQTALALMIGGLALVFAACSRDTAPTVAHQSPVVVVAPAQRGSISRTITLPGDLVGYYQSTLYAKVTGYLKSISVDKGDWVKEGQVLAQIEVPELRQRLERARADLEVQKITYDRLEKVFKSDPRLVARQDVDVAYGKFQEAKAQVDELSALVSYTKIIAPFDGVITGRFVDPGALIRASGGAGVQGVDGGGGGPPTALLSEAMMDKMRIYLYVPEGVVGLVRRGMPATLTVQDYPGRTFTGKVTRFNTSLDLSTRTMLTEVDIRNPEHELYPGMYASVTLELERHNDALKVRDSAVGTSADGSYVYVVREGVLSRIPVTTGIRSGSFVEITSGLKGGEQVVTALDPGLNDGEVVTPLLHRPAGGSRAALADNSDR